MDKYTKQWYLPSRLHWSLLVQQALVVDHLQSLQSGTEYPRAKYTHFIGTYK